MSGKELRRRASTALAVLVVSVATALGATADAEAPVEIGGQLPAFAFSPSLYPHAASKAKPTPIKLRLTSNFYPPLDYPFPPAVGQVRLQLDRHLDISTRGLPACAPRLQVTMPKPESVPRRCEPALVGNGKAELFFAFPEGKGVPLEAKLSLYNGAPHKGATRLWIYIPVPVPVPGAIIAPVDVMKVDQGYYGTEAVVSLPEVAGGAGRFERLSLNINREYTFKGQRRSVATFRCANGKFLASAEASFLDGTEAAAFPVIRPCAVSD